MSDKVPESLIDLIYRDPHRIPSLSAQIFAGLLKSSEYVTAAKNATDVTLGGGLSTIVSAKGEKKTSSESSSNAKDTREPGDIISVEVLRELENRGWLSESIYTATNSQIIRATGALHLLDPGMLHTAMSMSVDMEANPAKKRGLKNVSEMTGKLKLPPMFYLEEYGPLRRLYFGIVSPLGLVDPIETFGLKHGDTGLDGVVLVGIKEAVGNGFTKLPTIASTMSSAFQHLTALFVPEEAEKVAPICLYRHLERPT